MTNREEIPLFRDWRRLETRCTFSDGCGEEISVYRVPWGGEVGTTPDGEVWCRRNKDREHNASPFPNIRVSEGEVVIPAEDIMDELVARLNKTEAIEVVLKHNETREMVLEALAQNYNHLGFTEEERVKFLAKIKEELHDAALYTLAGRLHKLEELRREKFLVESARLALSSIAFRGRQLMAEFINTTEDGCWPEEVIKSFRAKMLKFIEENADPAKFSVPQYLNENYSEWMKVRGQWTTFVKEMFAFEKGPNFLECLILGNPDANAGMLDVVRAREHFEAIAKLCELAAQVDTAKTSELSAVLEPLTGRLYQAHRILENAKNAGGSNE